MAKSFAIVVLLLFINTSALGADESVEHSNLKTEDQAKYVSIHVEVKELGEAGLVLNEATEKLAQTLNSISNNLEDLSPEQLEQINLLADKVNEISQSLNATVNELPNAIERAQTPSAKIVDNALAQVKADTIDPVVDTLETWLIITIIGLIVLGIGLFIAFAYCAKQLGKIGGSIKDIASGYRIIPLEQYKEPKSLTPEDVDSSEDQKTTSATQ